MTEPKFTPGPWKVSDESKTIIRKYHPHTKAYGVSIGSASGYPNSGFFPTDEEAESNANLIAAAPELYEALVDMHRTQLNNNKHDPDDYENTEQFLRVTVALAKARGESHD